MRGEYDPIGGVSTEKEEGQIYSTLTQFPSNYTFQAAGKSIDLTENVVDDIKQAGRFFNHSQAEYFQRFASCVADALAFAPLRCVVRF
jgi:hypothetical protein